MTDTRPLAMDYRAGIGRLQVPASIYPPLHYPGAAAIYIASISHNYFHAPAINRLLNSPDYWSRLMVTSTPTNGGDYAA